jgi:hypothetical protein
MTVNNSTLNVAVKTNEESVMRNLTNTTEQRTIDNPVMNDLVAEGGESFLNYLECHGLADEDNTLVLSSKHHFYYDPNELESITTLINVKKLNLIKHLDTFLQSIVHVLSPESNFIGCFYDWKTQKGNGISSRMYKGFINFIDAKIDIEYDRNEVSKLLESHGLKVIDMREINGMTYFRAQHHRMNAN